MNETPREAAFTPDPSVAGPARPEDELSPEARERLARADQALVGKRGGDCPAVERHGDEQIECQAVAVEPVEREGDSTPLAIVCSRHARMIRANPANWRVSMGAGRDPLVEQIR